MPAAFRNWTVLPHGPVERLAENLWRVSGALPRMSLRRTMTIARMSDGGLVIWSAIALEEAAMREVESFGKPAYLLVPSGWHRLDAPAWKSRYPELIVLAPRGSRAKVEPVVPLDGTFDDFAADDAVRLQRLDGVADLEGTMLVTSKDGLTVVVSDAVFNMDRKRDVLGFLFTSLLGSAPGPRVSRLAKAAVVKDRAALKTNLLRLADLPNLVRLIVAHEKVAHGPDAAAALREAATFL